MHKPDFFLVGAPRSGTTSLYTYLKQHPEIYLSVLKEPHFFSRDLTAPPQAILDEETYLNLFIDSAEDQRRGEGSVWYLESTVAPEAIRAFSPKAQIIIMLRRPVDMMFSLHGLYLRTGNEDLENFADAWAAQEERQQGHRLPEKTYFPEGLQYREAATYSAKVARYLEVFGRRRVHVILFDDFVGDTPLAYRQTLEFLGVDADFEPEYDLARATAKLRLTAIRQLRRVPMAIKRQMRGSDQTHLGTPRQPLDADLRAQLEKDFTPEIHQLRELLKRDLSHWL